MEFKPHQKKVINYFKEKDIRGIILYHGLGSGKTITSLGISELYQDKKVFCIVPASMRTQWISELNKVVKNKKRFTIYSYEEFPKRVRDSNSLKNTIVIIDEAHRLRNLGIISKNILNQTKEVFKIILLTGTPIVNSPTDFSNLANLIYGENKLPVSDKAFDDLFLSLQIEKPKASIRCAEYSNIYCSEGGVRTENSKYCKYHSYLYFKKKKTKFPDLFKEDKNYEMEQEKRILKNKDNIDNKKKLNKTLFKKYVGGLVSYYRPEINGVDDYPLTVKHYLKSEMSVKQNKMYKLATKMLSKDDLERIEEGDNFFISDNVMFNAFLNKTRQISNCVNGDINSPKLINILRYCKKGPFPIIIYSNWINSGIIPMKKLLHLNNLEYYAFTGELNDKEKKRIVEKYNREEIQVLLLSSSGAEGLDLKNTRQIHIMEPHFNMAKINQVIGRGIRYKSHYDLNKKERKVDVYYWISKPDFSNIKKTNKSIKNNNLNNNKKKKTKKNDKIDKKIGVDEYLYKLSRNKEKYIEKFQKYIKKYSIENE